MVSTRKKKHQHKTQLSHLNETLTDFVIGNNANGNSLGKLVKYQINRQNLDSKNIYESFKIIHKMLGNIQNCKSTKI